MIEHKEYTKKIQASFERGEALIGPISASLPVTKHCNSKCSYCPPPRVGEIEDLTIEELTDVLTQLASLGVHQISITGGEPLLRRDLEEIVTITSRLNMRSLVLTNGTLLTMERAYSLLEAGLAGFVVSLDSLNEKTYRITRGRNIEPVLRSVNVLAQLKQDKEEVITSVISVLTKYNAHEIVELANYLNERWIGLQIQPCLDSPKYEIESSDLKMIAQVKTALDEVKTIYGPYISELDIAYLEHIPQYLRDRSLPENYRCLSAYTLVHLDAELRLYPCWLDLPVGNLTQTSLAELWTGTAMNQARQRIARGECTHCWLACDARPSLLYRSPDKRESIR